MATENGQISRSLGNTPRVQHPEAKRNHSFTGGKQNAPHRNSDQSGAAEDERPPAAPFMRAVVAPDANAWLDNQSGDGTAEPNERRPGMRNAKFLDSRWETLQRDDCGMMSRATELCRVDHQRKQSGSYDRAVLTGSCLSNWTIPIPAIHSKFI